MSFTIKTLGEVKNLSIVVHVTHEAIQKMGGIGAVLDGLLTTPSYNGAIERTFLVGPLFPGADLRNLDTILYQSSEGITDYTTCTGSHRN